MRCFLLCPACIAFVLPCTLFPVLLPTSTACFSATVLLNVLLLAVPCLCCVRDPLYSFPCALATITVCFSALYSFMCCFLLCPACVALILPYTLFVMLLLRHPLCLELFPLCALLLLPYMSLSPPPYFASLYASLSFICLLSLLSSCSSVLILYVLLFCFLHYPVCALLLVLFSYAILTVYFASLYSSHCASLTVLFSLLLFFIVLFHLLSCVIASVAVLFSLCSLLAALFHNALAIDGLLQLTICCNLV